MSNKEEVIKFLLDNPGHLKTGSKKLAKRFGCSADDVTHARRLVREGAVGLDTTAVLSSSGNCNCGHDACYDGCQANDIGSVEGISPLTPSVPEGMVVKSIWDGPGGKKMYSYKAINGDSNEDLISKKDIKKICKKIFEGTKSVDIEDTGKGRAILNVYISDEHLGCDTTDGLYENKFGPKALKKRHMNVLVEANLLKQFYGRFAEINIINLGDALDGMNGKTTRGGHLLPQDMSNKEVFRKFLEIQKLTVDTLVKMDISDKINYVCIANSNHGGDMEYMAFYAFEQYVKYIYPDIGFTIYEEFLNEHKIGDHTFILTHGKDENQRFKGLPLNLDDKSEKFINNFIDEKEIPVKNLHVVKGDLHQSASYASKRFRYRNCGSMMGSSAWIMANFGNTKPRTDYDVILGDTILEGHIKH